MKLSHIILVSSISILISTQYAFATVPSSPPSTSSAPNGGWFANYFNNIKNNPCLTAWQAVRSYNNLLVPQCGYLFWMLNGGGEVEYTGNVRVIWNFVTTGNITSNNITTSSINGNPITNFVSIPNLSPNLSPWKIPKTVNSLSPNSLWDSNISEDGFWNIGIGTNSPSTRFQVNGEISAISGYNDILYVGWDSAGNDLEIGTTNTSRNLITFWNRWLSSTMDISAGTGYFRTVKISWWSPGAWKVLTSDASGNATWQNQNSGLKSFTLNADICPGYWYTPYSGDSWPWPAEWACNWLESYDITFPIQFPNAINMWWDWVSNLSVTTSSQKYIEFTRITITWREAWDWPAPGTVYEFGPWRTYNFNTEYEVFTSANNNHLYFTVNENGSIRYRFNDWSPQSWWVNFRLYVEWKYN